MFASLSVLRFSGPIRPDSNVDTAGFEPFQPVLKSRAP
ncbi:unnamed protein product [Ciceribacter sp. T2.26MG-112.2]|nr:unnamed protein product [Ciceribacter naphthalenivorans]